MRKINYNREEIEQTIDRIVERTQRMDLMWDWPCGVAYYGIAEAYTATGKKLYIDFLKDRIDELINVGLPAWTVNTCAMGHSLLSIWQETGDEKYLEIIHSKIDYLRNEAPRFSNHVLQHTVSSNNDFPEQCWADTLFMAAFFMLRCKLLGGIYNEYCETYLAGMLSLSPISGNCGKPYGTTLRFENISDRQWFVENDFG